MRNMDRTKDIITSALNDIVNKFELLDQLVLQLINEERTIRAQMQQDCQDLKLDVEQAEANHQKLQDFLKFSYRT